MKVSFYTLFFKELTDLEKKELGLFLKYLRNFTKMSRKSSTKRGKCFGVFMDTIDFPLNATGIQPVFRHIIKGTRHHLREQSRMKNSVAPTTDDDLTSLEAIYNISLKSTTNA